MATKKKRSVLRSTKSTKLYALREGDGTFEDIQRYKRAHSSDVKRTSKAELATIKASKKTSTNENLRRGPDPVVA